MDFNLKNKAAIITGASSGIGRAAAKALAKEGCQVAVCARQLDKLEALRQETLHFCPDFFIYQADVSKEDELEGFIDAAHQRFGRVDIMYNNAGISYMGNLTEMRTEDWNRIMSTNLTAVWKGSSFAAKYMKAQRSGVIISTTSLAARIATTSLGAYAISKSGVSTMTKILASELAPYHIRVNAVSPGVILSDMLRNGVIKEKGMAYVCHTAVAQRLGDPEDVAKAVVFLASDAASYITGEILDVSGGKFIVQDPWAPWENACIEKPYMTDK